MAKVITEISGIPANDAERKAIGLLRDNLPDSWMLFHNFELRQGEEVFEIDLAVMSPHAVYLVDVKGTHGLIDVYGSKWYPEGRQPFHSPLAKLRNHAKILASIIKDSNPGLTELRKAHVQAVVLLTADDAKLNDPAGIDSPDVTDLKHCINYLSDKKRIPDHRLDNIQRHHAQIFKAITGKAKPKSSALVFRDWQVEEKLGGDDHYTEYRAKHSLLGKTGGMARLRVYQADPYQDEADRKEEFKKISNAYRAVAHMPTHANILAVKDLFVLDEEDRVVLVTEDLPGQALRQHIKKSTLALTFDQKLEIMRNVLSALDHAHKHEVIHRNLTPDAIVVTKGGQARVTGFDFARVGKNRTSTIADQIVEDLDSAYQSPECYRQPTEASIASDLYSVGLIFYELITGEQAFENIDQMMEADGKFPIPPSEVKTDLPKGFDAWLQKFCEFDPEDRHSSAAVARKGLDAIILPEAKDESAEDVSSDALPVVPEDLTSLQRDDVLADRFRVQEKLGSGGFGVVYKVFDSFGDVVRVIKMITRDRRSVYERLRREYKTLTQLPEHPHVVKVVWADRFSDKKQTPYIVFEYVEGLDVSDLIDAEALSLNDAVQIIMQSAKGLDHLHKNGVYHQDMKPSNLLWTDKGVRIIDFNVAVSENDDVQGGGGTRRYLPPDYDLSGEPSAEDRIDRDLYALGVTFYECLTGGAYPFEEMTPPPKKQPREIKQFKGCSDLSSGLVKVLHKLIAPERKDRYQKPLEMLAELEALNGKYRSLMTTGELTATPKAVSKLGFKADRPNFNPYVSHLLTLYSQSQISNAGTRGLDDIGKATYVSTYLDEKLKPALLRGDFRLVVISGNAGDGKTAFIQQFESEAERVGAQFQRGANGAVFQLKGHTFQSNYDGSQDEGDEQNDDVLLKFFSPFKGKSPDSWPTNQTRIIAINEGRLVDFFLEHEKDFPELAAMVQQGLAGKQPESGVSVINLNLRSVVSDAGDGNGSILKRLINRMTQPEYWSACEECDLKGKCYAYHNASTFQDPTAGPKITERLEKLYTITHLRGRLHITMRDLRSALAYMLVGTEDCDGIHQLYQNGGEASWNRILEGYYFNSWIAGYKDNADRLIKLLQEIDVAQVSNPALDRELGFLSPDHKKMSRFNFGVRPTYDEELIGLLFNNLPRDFSIKRRNHHISKHQNYLSHMRRKHFFECRDEEQWKAMLPYKTLDQFIDTIHSDDSSDESIKRILMAINRGEGLSNPDRLGLQLALRVRKVEKGTIRSYRLFDGSRFSFQSQAGVIAHPFLETFPQNITLHYDSGDGHTANLTIHLDVYEMLMRLNDGYRPRVEEEEGFYMSLSVFKNVLSSAPYQEVLLTETGHRFYEIERKHSGVLNLTVSEKVEEYHANKRQR
ncbi:protein kinase [Marinicella pacifica]|uniref:non-specific serine/threonine protein kinase n=1 Tax=Marinicella pacifica TaxID=1171543 RepID=A0A917CYI2_9GAMM|nr:protein kinase [Marinicella pacifica]GGG02875.1 protein kinase [Marinicella pacifica]